MLRRIASVLALCGVLVVTRAAVADDAADVKAAATSFFKAMEAGNASDAKAMASGSDKQLALLDTLVPVVSAFKQLENAAVKKWGEEGRKTLTQQGGGGPSPFNFEEELKKADVKMSSIVLSTQVQPAGAKKTANPLVRDGIELVPNLTHIISRDQKLYVYYEVYEPQIDAGRPLLATNLAFYRNGIKVLETPSVERDSIDAVDRKAAVFQFEVAANSLAPGLYTCQINLVDQIAAHAAFPRVELFVRNSR